MERKDLSLLIVSASLLGVAFLSTTFAWTILGLFSVYFYIIFKHEKQRGIFKYSYLYFFVFFYVINIFVFEVLPLDFLSINRVFGFILVFIGHFAMSAIMALLFQIPYGVLCISKQHKYSSYGILILGFTLLEIGLEFLGYPLFKIALPLATYPSLIQIASIVGISGCSLIVYLCNALLFELFYSVNKRAGIFLVSIGLIVWLCAIIPPLATPVNQGSVALIQANVASNQKWDKALDDANFLLHYNLSKNYFDNVDLVIWPETAIPYNQKIIAELELLSDNMIIGTFDQIDNQKYNALWYKATNQFYHKRYLVPLGEYIPSFWSTLLPILNEFQLGSTLSTGKNNQIFNTPKGKVSSLICFESMISSLAIDNVAKGGELLLVVSNDSWFKDIEKQLHFNHAIFRAIETRKTVIRVGNTGTSAIINLKGEVEAVLKNDTYKVLMGIVEFNDYQSIYVLCHRVWTILMILGFLALIRFDKEAFNNIKLRFYR